MFETFNVPGVNISNQAVLTLAASWNESNMGNFELTGIVVDVGESMTYVIPIVDGNIIITGVQQIPIGGKDSTLFVQELMRDKYDGPKGISTDVAKDIKENHAYTCADIVKEFMKLETNPTKICREYTYEKGAKNKHYSGTLTYERFLAPEAILNPNVSSSCSSRSCCCCCCFCTLQKMFCYSK